MYLISVIPTNPQAKKIMQPTSIGGFPHKRADGVTVFRTFKDEFGNESDLYFPTGGELMLDPDKEIDRHNIEVFEAWKKAFPATAVHFTVTDLEAEKGKKRDMRKSKTKALGLVSSFAAEGQYDTILALARRLGLRKFEVERAEAIDYLEEIADSDPLLLIGALEDPDKDLRFLIEQAIARNILSRSKEGVIKYGPMEGGQPIGRNEDEVVIYMKNQTSFLGQLMAEVEERAIVAPAPSTQRTVAVTNDEKPEDEAALLLEVQGWIEGGILIVDKDEKDKVKNIRYSSMVMGKTPEKVVAYLLKNKHFITIIRQRAAK